jgi:hypothetical protein
MIIIRMWPCGIKLFGPAALDVRRGDKSSMTMLDPRLDPRKSA